MNNPVLYLIAAAWIPVPPAFLFYRLLPSEARVDGPLGGLKIKLGGAFAGYFALTLIMMAFLKTSLAAPDVWTVKGRIENLAEADVYRTQLQVLVEPGQDVIEPDGKFQVRVLDPDNGFVAVEGAGYGSNSIDLAEQKDRAGRVIQLSEPLRLTARDDPK